MPDLHWLKTYCGKANSSGAGHPRVWAVLLEVDDGGTDAAGGVSDSMLVLDGAPLSGHLKLPCQQPDGCRR